MVGRTPKVDGKVCYWPCQLSVNCFDQRRSQMSRAAPAKNHIWNGSCSWRHHLSEFTMPLAVPRAPSVLGEWKGDAVGISTPASCAPPVRDPVPAVLPGMRFASTLPFGRVGVFHVALPPTRALAAQVRSCPWLKVPIPAVHPQLEKQP